MFIYIIYFIMIVCVSISFMKDKNKTKKALKKSWKSFENILPQLLSVVLIIGIMLSILDKNTISRIFGSETGALGMAIAALIGSVTLIPGFVAFPLAESLLNAGAGYGQITMFISTLMMVGVVTIPVEKEYFGKKLTIKRNIFCFIYAVIISIIIGGILI